MNLKILSNRSFERIPTMLCNASVTNRKYFFSSIIISRFDYQLGTLSRDSARASPKLESDAVYTYK